MSAVWAKLETHVVNGAFPLQRCVGSTDHSGVFLTQSTPHAPSAVALKLIPFDPETAEAQVSQWRAAVELSHPHLLRMFEAGDCYVDGQRFVYARMEFADQTLEQVLERRTLTEDEVREMLGPTLGALEYLHQRGLVQGALKPSNFLVVGPALKLATDTVHAVADADADVSTSDDVRALGATLCEALTRLRPPMPDGSGEIELPAQMPASFRGIVSRCLSADPRDRPTVAQLQSWLQGEPFVAASPTLASTRTAATRLVVRVELPSAEKPGFAAVPARATWRVIPLVVAAVVVMALAWIGYRMFASSSLEGVVQEAPVPVQTAPVAAATPEPPAAPPTPVPVPVIAEPPPASPTPVLPTVSQASLDTIRGTVRVTVRVTVDSNGAVIAATPDDPGPSPFFERRSLEAARKWTFAPADTERQRSMRVRFAFTRSGVTASAEPLP